MQNSYSSVALKKHQCGIFHYFGDPSMQMYTSVPQQLGDISIGRYGEDISIDSQTECNITICSEDNGYSYYKTLREGSDIVRNVPANLGMIISLYTHNYVPVVYGDPLYLQNESICRNLSLWNIKKAYIGSDVTSLKNTGEVIVEDGGSLRITATEGIIIEKDFTVQRGGKLLLCNSIQ